MQRNLLVACNVREEDMDIVEIHLYFLLGLICISLSGFICISCHRSTYPCRNTLRPSRNSHHQSAAVCHMRLPYSRSPVHSSRRLSRNNPRTLSCYNSSLPGNTQWCSSPPPPHSNPRQPCLTSYSALPCTLR